MDFYSKISYGLNHAKSALTATNFEHQMYYADRGVAALKKAKKLFKDCSCDKAKEKTIDALEVLTKAIDPQDWDAGRFYTKKSIGYIQEAIGLVDVCNFANNEFFNAAQEVEPVVPENEVAEAIADVNNSLESEMISVFNKHATEKLIKVEKAIAELTALATSIKSASATATSNNSLAQHQLAYLKKAKELLESGITTLKDSE